MSDTFDHAWDAFDPDRWGEDDQRDRNEPQCKYCGSTDVRWRLQTGKWTLFSSQPGVLHQCRIAQASPDDFDVIEEKP